MEVPLYFNIDNYTFHLVPVVLDNKEIMIRSNIRHIFQGASNFANLDHKHVGMGAQK